MTGPEAQFVHSRGTFTERSPGWIHCSSTTSVPVAGDISVRRYDCVVIFIPNVRNLVHDGAQRHNHVILIEYITARRTIPFFVGFHRLFHQWVGVCAHPTPRRSVL